MTEKDVVLEVKDLHTYFFNRRGVTKAVDGVSFSIREGETLGIVGESGCGKTMTALSLLRLIPKPAARIVSGEILLEGEDLVTLSDNDMREVRGRKISMILQDPQTSLNPVFTIGVFVVGDNADDDTVNTTPIASESRNVHGRLPSDPTVSPA